MRVPRAKPEVEELSPYVAPLEGRRGKLRLDFNEHTLGPSESVLDAIRALPADAYATYPEYAGLHADFARHCGVREDQVQAFNGADAAIRAIFDAFGETAATFLTTAPTFGYYGPCAAQQGMTTRAIEYPQDLSFPLTEIREALASSPRLLFICNPNNPTGTLLPPEQIVQLARSAPETLVVVDEIYARFAGATTLPGATSVENLLVLRSLSKTHGLAALRVGFAVGHAELVERLSRVIGPYDLNMFAVVAARAALADDAHVERYVREVLVARSWTIEQLADRGIRHARGEGNYILVWPPGDTDAVVAQLDGRGILVRNMRGKPVIDGSFRLTIGTGEQMARFMEEFDAVLGRSRGG